MSPNRHTLRTLVAAVVLAPLAVAGPASARPAAIHATTPTQAAANTTTVTLITGDKVSVTKQDNGKPTVLVKHGPGRERIVFSAREAEGHLHVVPSDAGPLLAAGRLDRRLFDITRLTEFGYDDATRDSLPLIVTGGGAVGVAGARVTRHLPSVNGVAMAESKQDATAFWQSLTGPAAAAVGKVWLSGKMKLVDEGSNAQIGVPAARTAGYDGKGVTVAVLDTGVDAAHPDLKDVLGETQDFTGSADGVKDNVGHGTHVASIIAGTGARIAANEGVAPRATVLMGKVCGTQFCEEDAILAGMEWAAGKAKVVNMSLGDNGGTNEDLLSQAVNKLTASRGTLFVASAGNSFSSYTVGAPAAADAALAVASVNRSDAVSAFSSKGPRLGDHAVKPDIAAPGEGIVAARATGTSMGSPVDDFYTAASGTSMSAPHVAGVAALLAQARPDWTANKLKAALMSSSAVPENLGVFQGGAGRVDAARAVSQTVFAESSVSFPQIKWPFTAPAAKTVTYRNEGSASVTLNLALSDKDSVFALGDSTLTVPANGTAQTTVSVDTTKLPTTGGTLSARIAATAVGVVIQTAVGVVAEAESYTVKVTLLDRNGKPASGEVDQSVALYGHTVPGNWAFDPDVIDGVATARVPKGDYTITGETGTGNSTTLEVVAKYTVDKDSELTLDARKGNRTDLTVADRPGAVSRVFVADFLLGFNGRGVAGMLLAFGNPEFYVVPAKGDQGTTIQYGLVSVLGSPANEPKPYRYYVTSAAPPNVIPANPVFQVRTKDLAQRNARFRGQGKQGLAEFGRAPRYLPGQFFSFGAFTTVALPTVRTEYLSPEADWSAAISFQRPVEQPNPSAPFGMVWEVTGKPATGRPVADEWNAAVIGPSLALSPNFNSQVYRFGNDLGAFVPLFAPAAANQGNNVGFQTITSRGDTTLQLEGHEPVGSGLPGVAVYGGLPAESARYTLRTSATRIDWVPWSELSTNVEATWTFSSAAADFDLVPLMYLRTTGPFDGINRAKPGLFSLSIDVLRQPRTTSTAKVRTVTLEYSSDDGKTWTNAPILRIGDTWRTLMLNPNSGFVSLRTTATDSAGDTHSTTVIRAYGIES